MRKDVSQNRTVLEPSLSLFTLFALAFFTYGIFVYAPYAGFRFNPLDGAVLAVYVEDEPALKEGDTLVRVGEITWEDYYQNSSQGFFEGSQPGDVVPIIVRRDGSEISIAWKLPGFNQPEFNIRFFNIWWLAYVFWFFGYAAQSFMRPPETARRLLTVSFYLFSILLITGSMSGWHMLGSSVLLRAVTWCILPVYLHLHWIFPKPLLQSPKWAGYLLYGVSLSFAAAELFPLLPRGLYFLAFLLALGGSLTLLAIHFARQPEHRREIGALIFAVLLVFAPLVSFGINGASSNVAFLAFLALPFLPMSYFYTIYRRQLGGLELRANRAISIYAYLILLAAILPFLLRPVALAPMSREMSGFVMTGIALSTVLVATWIYPAFQSALEKNLLGIKLPRQNLQEAYSSLIISSSSINDLAQTIGNEVMPSLLIRQFAFLQVVDGKLQTLLAGGVPSGQLPDENKVELLARQTGRVLSAPLPEAGWIRLILPLKVGDSTLGFWLLGRRDPDDLYPFIEIPILQSLADQTAVALSNILQTEQLRAYYQTDIETIENERKRISRDLHDDVLNQLADMRNSLDQKTLPPAFLFAYDDLKKRLREIINDLRPPMLDEGLSYAIKEMADNFREKNGGITIILDVQSGVERLPEKAGEHLFHIAHEACKNALKHSNCRTLTISGIVSPERVDLSIQDDGNGFDSSADLNALLANRHFGLAHMKERAHLIGAEVEIRSQKDNGTVIRITWQAKSSG